MSKGSDPTMAGCINPKHRIKKLQDRQSNCYNEILILLDRIGLMDHEIEKCEWYLCEQTNYSEKIMNFNWNDHYKKGGKSGDPEDYKIAIPWKKNILFQYCNLKTDSIIDIGCGDLQFWANELPVHYTGVDISPVIILKNKISHPEVTFLVSNAASELNVSADVVICFDLLFHIIDDDEYIKILMNMKKYAKKYIILYTWNRNVFANSLYMRLLIALVNFKHGKGFSFKPVYGDGGYQKYRDFMKIAVPIFAPDFKLAYAYASTHWSFATMYVFEHCDNSQFEV